MATLGKALGGLGAFVAGAPEMIEWLVQRARTSSIRPRCPEWPRRSRSPRWTDRRGAAARCRLGERIAQFRRRRRGGGARSLASRTAIQPLLVGDPQAAVSASSRLAELGFLVPAIRPPTVPEGTARLRISLCADHTSAEVAALAGAIAGHPS